MTLSYRARGLLAHLRDEYQPGAEIDTAALAHPERREGRDAVRQMLRELADAGHIEERRAQRERGYWRTTTHLVTPGTEKPGPDSTRDQKPQVRPETENPAPETPGPEKPSPVENAFPQVAPEPDCPAPEKPGPSTCTPEGSTSSGTSVDKEPTTSASRPSRTPARTHTRERPTAAELNRTAARPDAYRLVASWANTQPPGRILDPDRRELAKHLDTLLAQGATLPILKAALDLWAAKGRTPSFLPHAYREAAAEAQPEGNAGHSTRDVRGSRARPAARGSARGDKARAWLALGNTDTEPSAAAWSPLVIEGGTRDAG